MRIPLLAPDNCKIVRIMAGVGAGVVLALAPASGAWAHGGDAPDATNYRTTVSTVEPFVPGLSVRAVEAGARLELTNHTGRTVEVLGYSGEPFVEVRPDGVYENTRSPSTYLSTTLSGDVPVPPEADPTAPPSWRRVSGDPVARWHDHRTHWMSADPPPVVDAAPGRPHRISDWAVPLRDGVSTVLVRGTLDWVPPPSGVLWWGLVVAGALGVAGLGRIWARAAPALSVLAIAGGLTALGYAVAREIDAGTTALGPILGALLTGQLWPTLTGLAAVAAGVCGVARRPAADLALGLGGACLALFAGVGNAAVFVRSVAPVPGDPLWARTAIGFVIAAGAGLAGATALHLRAAAQPSSRAAS